MTKEEVLTFNLSSVYRDYIESYIRELSEALTKDGRIKKEKLIITPELTTLHPDTGALRLDERDHCYDEIFIYLHNHKSVAKIAIEYLNTGNVTLSLYPIEHADPKAWSHERTMSEIIENGDFIEAIITWIDDAELTRWAMEFFNLEER